METMTERTRIIGNDGEEGFDFERAWIASQDGVPTPRAIVGGVECCIETKPGPLEFGVALCEPMDGRQTLQAWPVWVEIEVTDPDGSKHLMRMQNFTDRSGVVAAARRFAQLEIEGKAVVGMTL